MVVSGRAIRMTSEAFCTSVWKRASLRRAWAVSVMSSRSRAMSTWATRISIEAWSSGGTSASLDATTMP